MRCLILLVVCLLGMHPNAVAATKHAPLSPLISSAKTIYIDNQTGTQDATDWAYEAFTKWGRYTIVQSRADADLIATFTNAPELVHGTEIAGVAMVITARNDTEPLFQDAESATPAFFPKKRMGLSARRCIEELEKRLK